MNLDARARAESIRQRLRNVVRARGEDVQFGLQRYAAERFLFRLGESRHRDRFILKGAALFALWGGAAYRATRDLDFTAYGNADPEDLLAAFREICSLPGPGDELHFDAATLSATPILDDSEYRGLRLHMDARLDQSRISIQIDLGFGDAIHPGPQDVTYPTLLGHSAPRILAYPVESVVAEKLHAMVLLGERNSRFKDFYDVHVIAGQFPFDGEPLSAAVAATFERRRTGIVESSALSTGYFADAGRGAQWTAYVRRNELSNAPGDFTRVGETIIGFLGPVWNAMANGEQFGSTWAAGGPWRTGS